MQLNNKQTRRRPVVKQTEPPSCSSNIVLIGKNDRGRWVAREQNGLFGGLFISRTAAVKFALFENGNRPEAIFDAAHVLELHSNGTAFASGLATPHDRATIERRAA
jgi:hypothetical protein